MQFEIFAVPQVAFTIIIVVCSLMYIVYYLTLGGTRDILIVKMANSYKQYSATRPDNQTVSYRPKGKEKRSFIVNRGDVLIGDTRFGKTSRLLLAQEGSTHTTLDLSDASPDSSSPVDKTWLKDQMLEARVIEQHTAGMQLTLKKQIMGILIGLGMGGMGGMILGFFMAGAVG